MTINEKYNVGIISPKETYEWLMYKHYAHRIPSITLSFGLFAENVIVGILTVGKPASNALCDGVCGKEYSRYVFELNRLCVVDGLEKNVLSYFVSNCLKFINKKENMILVSYADSSMGHHGYIYQATNWIYTGLSAKRTEKYDPNDLNRHSKSVTELVTKEQYKLLPSRDRARKHRYIYFLGKNKGLFKDSLKYKVLPYPKGDNKRYDSSYTPQIQERLAI